MSLSGIAEDARELSGELARLRHRLHRSPETGLNLPRTQEAVLAELDGLPLEIRTGEALSSVVGVLRGAGKGPAVLLRGDMDALPIAERSGVEFAATGGSMHACGHDLHTTMLVGAARLLADRRAELDGDVVFMFQPGEEGHDGARHMISEGVLEASGSRPVAAYGLHVMASVVPHGVFTTRPGPMMAASDTVTVTVTGAGGHGSAPHRGLDPIPAACTMVGELQTMVTRRFDVFDPVVVTVGSFHAGTQHNIIPEQVRFEATVRSLSAESHARVKDAFVTVCEGVAGAHGLAVDIDYRRLYPVTENNAEEAGFAADTVRELHGEQSVEPARNPFTCSEDFSRVLHSVPGAFLALGACPEGADPASMPNNHSAQALFADEVLDRGAAAYAGLAHRRLAAAG
ncbi:M20 metallopeptidase family protein [Sciscionella marina]|uniref:M20 metallopeptidase family protein n=1 Tax=Sciscionella marina TaxID=508770 RepID=UPI000372919F|nr:M20 family metallopeptidase [Sciscionella marina]